MPGGQVQPWPCPEQATWPRARHVTFLDLTEADL